MTTIIGAGELNVLAELQKKVPTRTSAGGMNPGWVKERDIWIKVKGLSPSLKLEARAREPQLTHEIFARQEEDLDATKRLVVVNGAGAAVDLTDYDEGWKFNETASTQDALGINSVQNLARSGDIAVRASDGAVEDPAGSTRSRGPLEPEGGTSNQLYFTKSQAQGDIFDLRGKTSFTLAAWYKIPSGETGEPYLFVIHNPASAAGQAVLISTRHAGLKSGAANDPGLLMLDGITPFANKSLEIGGDAAGVPLDTWQFLCCGYDASRDKLFGFWGRGPADSYYNEDDAVAAGFGYSHNNGVSGFGRYLTGGGDANGTNSQFYVDQALWWNGRALTEIEANYLWNNHVGRAVDDLVATGSTRYFMIDGIPEDIDEQRGFVRIMAVEGVAT